MNESRKGRLYLRCLAGLGSAALIFGAGVYAAHADSVPVSRPALSYSGLLSKNGAPLVGDQTLVFTFNKAALPVCQSPSLSVTSDSAGRFQVSIPMTSCPSSLLDGSSVTVDITVGGAVAAKDIALAAVPYALHAEQLGTADCPSGYDRDSTPSQAANVISCVRGPDHVVRVGSGATAFWIDRYEASIWGDLAAQGQQYGAGVPYPASFPRNGQIAGNPLYAVSKLGTIASTGATWFQASRACRASGKRLPTGDEWDAAASGTPAGSDDPLGKCTTHKGPNPSGQDKDCVSVWGAEDMVGNAAEVIAEWALAVPTEAETLVVYPWPSGFDSALMYNITSVSATPGPDYDSPVRGPLGISRGGNSWDGSGASVFAIATTQTVGESMDGFRCVIPR
jgi:hypothetical protein